MLSVLFFKACPLPKGSSLTTEKHHSLFPCLYEWICPQLCDNSEKIFPVILSGEDHFGLFVEIDAADHVADLLIFGGDIDLSDVLPDAASAVPAGVVDRAPFGEKRADALPAAGDHLPDRGFILVEDPRDLPVLQLRDVPKDVRKPRFIVHAVEHGGDAPVAGLFDPELPVQIDAGRRVDIAAVEIVPDEQH